MDTIEHAINCNEFEVSTCTVMNSNVREQKHRHTKLNWGHFSHHDEIESKTLIELIWSGSMNLQTKRQHAQARLHIHTAPSILKLPPCTRKLVRATKLIISAHIWILMLLLIKLWLIGICNLHLINTCEIKSISTMPSWSMQLARCAPGSPHANLQLSSKMIKKDLDLEEKKRDSAAKI